MQPSEVRDRVLHDHASLRASVETVDSLARRVIEGGTESIGELRAAAAALLEALQTHMAWEDRHLAVALREADAWGPEREARLASDHREQRQILTHVLAALTDPDRPVRVQARVLRDWASLLREDMREEERELLDAQVLRDDVVGIDVEAG